ncbi:MAG: hypothetical protein OEM01_07060 [Desulfobulbaceae bacterium]|nr:hypothetical protein [Desulfobulbaceae bacterium]
MAKLFLQAVCRTLILLVIVSLPQAGCTGKKKQHILDANVPGTTGKEFTGTWWNYYERALTSIDGGFYHEAVKDLQQAVQGNDFDQWQFETPDKKIIDYFPHREMGIIYYQKKEYNKAISELEYSLESTGSDKAYFYLNQARAKKIVRDGLDHSPPELSLESSTARELTSSFSKRVKGVAKDDTYLASIQVDDQQIPMVPARKSHVFTIDIPLQQGENNIRVLATDLTGKLSEKYLEIYGDRQGPLIEIIETTSNREEVAVRGITSDAGGLVSLKINGRKWPVTGAAEGYNFKFTQPLDTITITAKDRTGNVTQATLWEQDLADDSSGVDEQLADASSSSPIPTDSPENPEISSPTSLSNQPEQFENDPPYIYLEGIVSESETFDDSIVFKVSVADNDGIHSIFVNTEPILLRNGKKVFFSLLEKLAEGRNEFHFIAFDLQGNKTDKKIVITRKITNIQQTASRMRIAILPFVRQGNSELLQQNIAEQLADYQIKQARFQITDHRVNEALAGKLTIHTLHPPSFEQTAGDNLDPAVDGVLDGTIKLSSGYGEIVARLIDVRTAKVMAINDVFGKISAPHDLDSLLQNLADKFRRDFPVKKGMITAINEKEVTINLGETDSIKPYSRFIVYRESPPFLHPVTRAIIESEPEILGILQVTTVQENSARANIIKSDHRIQKYDKVIAR